MKLAARHPTRQALRKTVDEALAIVENHHATYIAGDHELRRLMNRATCERFLVRMDQLEGEEEPIYSQIRSLIGSNTHASTNRPHNGQDPQLLGPWFQRESNGADERTRTSTGLLRHGPEPCASTNSATSASWTPTISHTPRRSRQPSASALL
jgi:hypothetical protein